MKLRSRVERRKLRVRKNLQSFGVYATRPRLSVYRSNAHIWAQIIDDTKAATLVAFSDLGLKGTKTQKSELVGTKIAQAANKLKIELVVFDRGSYRYHGRVKALAEAARASGLKF